MNENYRKELKEKLNNVQDRKLELYFKENDFRLLKNPYLFLNYVGNPASILDRKYIKNQILNEKYSLEEEHLALGERYRGALKYLTVDELVEKQENLGARINHLKRRYRRVESFKKGGLLFKLSGERRAANNLLKKIKHEKENRKEFLYYTLEELWERDVSLEIYYNQKILERLFN